MTNLENTLLYSMSFPSDKSSRQKVVDSVIHVLFQGAVRPEIEKEELYLIIDEAVTNAMEHGNHWDPEKLIKIEIASTSSDITITITDQGAGFDTKKIRNTLRDRNILSTRGRGIYIISQFSCLSWNKQGNQIRLQIKRSIQ